MLATPRPHRPGWILISIAIAGGLLVVVNATHAVQQTATLSNRYLILQSPARTLRADIAVFPTSPWASELPPRTEPLISRRS